jgi:hypothetical protein
LKGEIVSHLRWHVHSAIVDIVIGWDRSWSSVYYDHGYSRVWERGVFSVEGGHAAGRQAYATDTLKTPLLLTSLYMVCLGRSV